MNKLLNKKDIWLPVSILIVITFLIYAFNLNNGLFWDDDDWIINNASVHSLSFSNIKFWITHNTLAGVGLQSNYYRPFLFFTFALNYVISEIRPFFYHLTSNAIHIFNGIIVFWLIRRIYRKNLLAFLVSLFFLVHPLQTEAVTYISGRGDVLVSMFMLLSISLFYAAELKNEKWLNYKKILSLVFLVFALLSRETGIIFPVLSLAFYVFIISKERLLASIKIGILKTWPYFAVVIIYGIMRLTVLNFLNTLNFYSEGNLYSENLYVRILTFLPILGQYIRLLFVPTGLHMERSSVVYSSILQWPIWPIVLAIIGLFMWIRFLYKKVNFDNSSLVGPREIFSIWLLGLSWFFISLGPVSGITPINALMYEHWLYMPMIGFWLIISFYLTKLLDKFKNRRFVYALIITILVSYLLFFSAQSVKRNILWGNPIKFYENILDYEPESVRISNNLGNQYFNKKDFNKAELYYRKAVDAESDFAQPYFNLGSILQSKGDIYGAIKLYEKSISVDPNFYYPYQNLAVIYAKQGDFIKAVKNIETLKIVLPNNPRVYYNSALIYVALNNKEKALLDLRQGLKYSHMDLEAGKFINDLIVELSK